MKPEHIPALIEIETYHRETRELLMGLRMTMGNTETTHGQQIIAQVIQYRMKEISHRIAELRADLQKEAILSDLQKYAKETES